MLSHHLLFMLIYMPSRYPAVFTEIAKQSLTLGICYQLFGKPVYASVNRLETQGIPR
jgi:hypothetical protein